MRVLAVIPARGGSKGIPRKNLARLGGRPLLSYTCRAAQKARRLDRVILSTDNAAIARAGRKLGVEVPFLRPRALASDRAPMAAVLRHALRELERRDGYRADVVVVLQPTSPFRRPGHIDATVAALLRSKADSAVTVTPIPHNMSPDSALVVRSGRLVPLRRGAPVLRRQDKKSYVARNGPAVLAVRAALVMKGRLYGKRTVGVSMSALDSIDIDGPDDLRLAEALLRGRRR
jgi:CMP-N,N'-diacetyllegionaminic acid synthase